MEAAATCRDCNETLPLSAFTKNVRMSNGHQSRCRDCYNAVQRIRQSAYPPRTRPGKKRYPQDSQGARRSALRFKYGISLDAYDAMLADQGGVCFICREPETATGANGVVRFLTVDHDHSCCPGQRACGSCVRGLLCSRCNAGLGLFRDNPAILNAAVAYLARPAQE
ncbi:endonuclease VII domain-containing protein [Arthrobacter sp. ISL-69]|uniref:endonuclease VII domain-containing protein n=1 Tax=Arthrobacter sp. ISL-69 TaxID=2819113 RepID=UPI001BEAA45B|nr:endonuclease VII domain-containing protein [Arthrobacter sp. ISL-69]